MAKRTVVNVRTGKAELVTFTSKAEAAPDKIAAIRAKAQSRLDAGAPHNGARYDVSPERQFEVVGVTTGVANNKGLPNNKTSITVRDLSRTKHTFTQSEYIEWAATMRNYVSAVKQNAESHIDAIHDLVNDPSASTGDVQNYDITTGWPE